MRVWKTKLGVSVDIGDMDDAHLVMAIRVVIERAESKIEKVVLKFKEAGIKFRKVGTWEDNVEPVFLYLAAEAEDRDIDIYSLPDLDFDESKIKPRRIIDLTGL